VIATAVFVTLAAVSNVAPARLMRRRTLERPAIPRSRDVVSIARHVGRLALRRPAARGIFFFATASLARSRRHAAVLATYAGVALAVASISLLAAGLRGTLSRAEPGGVFLAVPLVAMFFAVFGVRTACAIPTELDANWPFRLAQPPVEAAHAATRLLVWAAVVPIAIIGAAVCASLWGWALAGRLAVLDLLTGTVLCEMALLSWTKVPFASGHEPAVETIRSRWLLFVLGLPVYAFGLASVQNVALRSDSATGAYLAAGTGMLTAVLVAGRRYRRSRPLMLDAPSASLDTLNLSMADVA
jgi:hypothetical protein